VRQSAKELYGDSDGSHFNFDSISSIARTEGPRGDHEMIEQTLQLTDEEKSLGPTR
jgi:hypothetical protein